MTDEHALDRSDPAYPGQAIYTQSTLRAYDTVVVGLSNSLVWRCPAKRILEQYQRHVTPRHLDVGPGTGYYLDNCHLPDGVRLTLLDANPSVLRFTSERLRRYRPATHAANVLKPIALQAGSFDSIGLSYVLHCLPAGKFAALDSLRPLLAPGGVLFGTTILGKGVRHNAVGRVLMKVYNRKGIFTNLDDSVEGLRSELASRFKENDIKVEGTVAFFAAQA